MITAGQALIIALTATASPNGQISAGNVIVEPRDERYTVSVVSVARAPSDQSVVSNGTLALIEKDTGRIVSLQKLALPGSGLPLPQVQPGSTPITAAKAYENAVSALQGHDNYDKQGRLSVILKPGHYEVTFPLIVTAPGSMGADYAYQIWLDAKTGATLKILVPS
jgi:hypothetical protein